MSGGAVEVVRARAVGRPARWLSRHRGPVALGLFWLVFVLDLAPFALYGDDSQRPYDFLRKLFGERVERADAYQFGLALFEAPFYALSKVADAIGIGALVERPLGPASIAVGIALLVLATVAILVPVLEGLRLPLPGTTLAFALFGTSLFFYGAFYPGQTHAVDALLLTVVVGLIYLYCREPEPSWILPTLIGLVVAVSAAVRYFSGFELVGLLAGLLWYRRFRDAALLLATPLAAGALLAVIPYVLTGDAFKGAAGEEGGLGAVGGVLTFAPLNPWRMLFTDERGLFVWTPVTFLALLGYARLLRTRRRERRFLVLAGLAGVSVILSYAFSPYWNGGSFGFSNRYLTSLFPLVAIGLGGLLEWRRRLVLALASVATAWSLCLAADTYLGLNMGSLDHGASSFVTRSIHGGGTPGVVWDRLYFNWNLKRVFGLSPGSPPQG